MSIPKANALQGMSTPVGRSVPARDLSREWQQLRGWQGHYNALLSHQKRRSAVAKDLYRQLYCGKGGPIHEIAKIDIRLKQCAMDWFKDKITAMRPLPKISEEKVEKGIGRWPVWDIFISEIMIRSLD